MSEGKTGIERLRGFTLRGGQFLELIEIADQIECEHIGDVEEKDREIEALRKRVAGGSCCRRGGINLMQLHGWARCGMEGCDEPEWTLFSTINDAVERYWEAVEE